MASVLQNLGLKRQVTVTAPVEVAQARKNLNAALTKDVVLSGHLQSTRRYWGEFNYPYLTLHVPRANRQFCFLTQGQIKRGDDFEHTNLDIKIILGNADEAYLLWMLLALPIMLGVVLRWFGIFLLPMFLAFFYGMTQWHLSYYAAEISKLLCDLMVGKETETGPFTRNWE